MKRLLRWTIGLLMCLLPSSVLATTWQVGPTRQLTTPAAAAAVVQDGDTVEFDPGTYTAGAVWTKHNLTLRGVGAVFDGGAVNGKAIWLVQGNNTTVEGAAFAHASVSDGNGAGIKLEGKGLTVRRARFLDNQNGLLAGGPAGIGRGSVVLVEYSEFARNGSGDGSTHNIYVNDVDSFTLQYSWSHGAHAGHLVKSRALVNNILYNRLVDDAGGTASYELDLPCGGVNTVIGNVIRQDAATENSTLMDHGNEIANPANCSSRPQSLFVAHNTFINDRYAATWLQIKGAPSPFVIMNNLFAGTGAFESPVDTSNIQTQTPAFLDGTTQKYQLTAASPGLNTGLVPSASLMPVWEYVHPLNKQPRVLKGTAWDVGAYEFGTPYADVWPAPVPPPPPPPAPRVVTTLPLPAAPGWYELANTRLRQVDPCPARNCAYTGVSGQLSVIGAYASGAADTTRNRLILFGGGHNSYYGNELYAVTFGATPGVERLTEPGTPQPCTPTAQNGTQPASRHTYDGMVYVAHVDKLFIFAGAIACENGIGSNDTWLFDFTTKTWQQMSPPAPLPEGMLGLVSSYDPVSKLIYIHDRKCLWTYSVETNTYTKLPGGCEALNYMDTSIIDPVRHEMLIVGTFPPPYGPDAWVYDIRPGLTSYKPTKLVTTGGDNIRNGYYPGLAYDAVQQKVVGWNGGDTAYVLDRTTNIWTAYTFPGGPGTAALGGTYKRFSYIPSIGAFVIVNSVDTNVFALKLSGDTPPPPPPPPPPPVPQDVLAYTVQRKWSDGTWRSCEAQGQNAKVALAWIQALPSPSELTVLTTGAPSAARAVQTGQRLVGKWDEQTTWSCFAIGVSARRVLVFPPR